VLHTVPGIGNILSRVLLYEIHDIARFPRGQDCVSSCRLVQCATESAGTRYGTAGTNIGHASLQWAVSEAAVLFLRDHRAGHMLKRGTVFDLAPVLRSSGRGAGEPAASLGHHGCRLSTVLWKAPCVAERP
jgi:transposase